MGHTLNIGLHNTNARNAVQGQVPHAPKPSQIRVLITKIKARRHAHTIVKALKEVKEFESGKKQPKSFEQFLKEL